MSVEQVVLPPRNAAHWLPAAARRFALATAGPVGSAVAQFVLTVQALHLFSPEAFGGFAFLLVAQQFSLALWNALFCAPLAVMLNKGDEASRCRALRCLLATNLTLAVAAGSAFAALGHAVGISDAALFAGFAAIALLRWFARAHSYATGVPLKTICSDAAYSAMLLVGVVAVAISEANSATALYAVLLVSAAVGLLPFGSRYLGQQFVHLAPRALKEYREVWRNYSRWSVAGVVTTEVTVNAHAYLVTLLAGPIAFAPLAASALVARPIGVAMNAVLEFERPQMARHISKGDLGRVRELARASRWLLMGGWVATALVAAPLVLLVPELLFSAQYSPSILLSGAGLWMAIAAVRLLRIPESAMLQAAGMFRALAVTSVVSSIISVAAVAVLIAVGGPLWSIGGVLLGEVAFALATFRQARSWRRATRKQLVHRGGGPSCD